MDASNLVRMVLLAAVITLSTSARFPNEVPPLDPPTMPSDPLTSEAVNGDGTPLDNPLTFFIHSSVGGAFGPPKGEPIDAEIGDRFPSAEPTFPFPDENGGKEFGSSSMDAPKLTAIAGDCTRGPEMGSSIVGKVDGFAVEVKKGGWKSKTVSFTVQFQEGESSRANSISFFGVLKSAPDAASDVAVVGGTGKYATARGSAKLQTARAVKEGMDGKAVRVTVKLNSSVL